jgi:uncharacterized protein YceH (UPF0502 family)
VEVRILGSLVEKEVTTPENYPLSLNALLAACNQTTNRDPVMRVDEDAATHAIISLRRGGLLRQIQPVGSRVTKFEHLLDGELGLDARQIAVLGVLMLRGPQTPGELHTRTARLAPFADIEDLESVLESLIGREPQSLATRIARRPGQKEVRYTHLLTGEPSYPAAAETHEAHDAPARPIRRAAGDDDRIAALERTVDALRVEVASLRGSLEILRGQWRPYSGGEAPGQPRAAKGLEVQLGGAAPVAAPTLDDCHAQALVLSAVVAFEHSSTPAKVQAIDAIVQNMLDGSSAFASFASVASSTFGIAIDPSVLQSYWETMKMPAPNAQISAFLKRVQGDPTLMQQFLTSATSYDALAQFAAANGLSVSATDLQNYIQPWATFTSLLQGLRNDNVISSQQFQSYAGYDPDSAGISGYGHDTDVEIMQGIMSAAGNAVRGSDFSALGMPIGVVVFPAAAIVIGGLSGQTYSWGDVGNMFESSFEDGLEGAADAVNDFGSSVSSVFD